MTVHKKLLIKQKVLNQIWWSWCYYNEEEMLYPAARLVFQVRRDTPSNPLLCNLHWLPVKQRIIFKLLLLVYKSLNNHAPKYLSDCLEIYVPGKRTRSSEDPLKLTYLTKRKQTGDRTFTVASSIEWNKLPLTLRQSPSIETFKKSLKTHLF